MKRIIRTIITTITSTRIIPVTLPTTVAMTERDFDVEDVILLDGLFCDTVSKSEKNTLYNYNNYY